MTWPGGTAKRWRVAAAMAALLALVTGCTGSGGGSPSPAAAPDASPSAAIAGRTYRMALPADWVVLGSTSYDAAVDATPDVATWLDALDLVGPNAFRAHEPAAGAGALRLAINPASPWRDPNDHPLSGTVAERLAGVTDEPIGDLVPVGSTAKATRFRWTEVLDWGSGSPSARAVVGYLVMAELDTVYVVWSYPADTDRLAEVEALMATFEVVGTAAASLPPGVTMPPSPTPFDKLNPPPEPPATAAPHGAPDLEALLPDRVGEVGLAKTSQTGVQLGLSPNDALLTRFGKQPADLATATAMPDRPPLLIVGVTRLRGVRGEELLAAMLADVPADEIAERSLAGRPASYVTHGAWPVWYVATGDLVYGLAGADQQVAEVAAALP